MEIEESSFPIVWKVYGFGSIFLGLATLLTYNEIDLVGFSSIIKLSSLIATSLISCSGIIMGVFIWAHKAAYGWDEIKISNISHGLISYKDIQSIDHDLFQFGSFQISRLRIKSITSKNFSIYLPTSDSNKYIEIIKDNTNSNQRQSIKYVNVI